MKVFGIGLNKTGTSTLGEAGRLMGLRVATWDPALFRETIVEQKRDRLQRTIGANDLFNDFPYPLLYRELDADYPGARFVLTRRASPEAWLKSIKAHAMRASPSSRTHEIVYGRRFPHGAEETYLNYYERHLREVREHFAGRDKDFLEICWEGEADWSRLATFLGVAAPSAPIAAANASAGKRVNPLRYAWNVAALARSSMRRSD